jgi:hypothetical protein
MPPVDGIASYRIRNLASTAFDHSVYFSNTTEFVSAVAFAAGSLTPSGPLGSTPIPGRLRQATAVRDLRVTALACGRVASFAALAAALIGLRTDLPDIGDAIVAFLTWLPLVPDSVEKWPGFVRGLLGALLVTVAGTATWQLLTGAWHALIRTDESRFFARQPMDRWPRKATAWGVAAGLVPTLAILALAVLRSDVSLVLWYVGLVAVGLLVVVRLMRTTEPRLSDPVGPGHRSGPRQ